MNIAVLIDYLYRLRHENLMGIEQYVVVESCQLDLNIEIILKLQMCIEWYSSNDLDNYHEYKNESRNRLLGEWEWIEWKLWNILLTNDDIYIRTYMIVYM